MSAMSEFDKVLNQRLQQAILKACTDNKTTKPSHSQLFQAMLSLYPLEPNDERWYALIAPLLYAID